MHVEILQFAADNIELAVLLVESWHSSPVELPLLPFELGFDCAERTLTLVAAVDRFVD